MPANHESPFNRAPHAWNLELNESENGNIAIILTHDNANEPIHATQARQAITAYLQDLEIQGRLKVRERLDDIRLVLSELIGNAILHSGKISEVTVVYSAAESELHITVVNPAALIPDLRGDIPANEHGRGIGITEVLTDDNVRRFSTDDGEFIITHAIFTHLAGVMSNTSAVSSQPSDFSNG